MRSSKVAIVGGGLAGLAAGLALKERGATVELFERTRLLGGRATSFVVDGHEVDNGQHVFLACCTEFIRFVERTGMGDRLYLQERFDALVLGDGVRSRLRAMRAPAPLHLAWSLLRYRHLNPAERFGIARALLSIRGALGSSESFGAWLRRHGQSARAFAAFWEPFVVPALNAPLDRIAAGDAAFVLITSFLDDPGAARFGWSKVPLAHIAAAAAARLDGVHTSTAVTGCEVREGDVTLTLSASRVPEERRSFDAIVLAVPPQVLGRIVGDANRYGLPPLDGYEAFAILDIHLWHDGPRLGFEFAALVDSPVHWIFQKGDGYLCCSVSAADEFMNLPTAELIARGWAEVCAAVPELRNASLTRSAVTRNPSATYLPRAGTQRPGVRTAFANVTIAGSWIETGWPDTMESAIRSGLAAANALSVGTVNVGTVNEGTENDG